MPYISVSSAVLKNVIWRYVNKYYMASCRKRKMIVVKLCLKSAGSSVEERTSMQSDLGFKKYL